MKGSTYCHDMGNLELKSLRSYGINSIHYPGITVKTFSAINDIGKWRLYLAQAEDAT